MIMQKFAFLFGNSYNPANIFFGEKAHILAVLFARRKKYRKYLRYILQSAKKSEKNCGIFFRAQKILQKLAQIFAIHFAERKKSGKKCGIFCRAQNILQKLAQIFAIYFADCKN